MTISYQHSLYRNLRLINTWCFFRGFGLTVPILVPYFQSKGLDLSDVFWLQAWFGIAISLLEVPSGYLSDRFGRKRVLLWGTFFWIFGFGVYALANGFSGFLLGEMLMAVGCSLFSGSDQAFTYDTLVELDQEERYAQLRSRQGILGNLAEACGGIAGGALAAVSLGLPVYLQCVVFLPMIPLVLCFREPKVAPLIEEISGPPRLRDIVRESVLVRSRLRGLIVLSALISLATLVQVWTAQPWLQLVGVPLYWFGVVWAALRLTVAGGALLAPRVRDRLGFRKLVWFLIAVLALSFGMTGFFPKLAALPFLFGFCLVRGVAMVIFSEAINREVSSDRRATVLSLEGLLLRLLFFPVGPGVGAFASVYGLPSALLLFGAGIVVASATVLILLGRSRTRSRLRDIHAVGVL